MLGVCTLFVYLVGVHGDLVAGVWYTCSSSLFTSIPKFAWIWYTSVTGFGVLCLAGRIASTLINLVILS